MLELSQQPRIWQLRRVSLCALPLGAPVDVRLTIVALPESSSRFAAAGSKSDKSDKSDASELRSDMPKSAETEVADAKYREAKPEISEEAARDEKLCDESEAKLEEAGEIDVQLSEHASKVDESEEKTRETDEAATKLERATPENEIARSEVRATSEPTFEFEADQDCTDVRVPFRLRSCDRFELRFVARGTSQSTSQSFAQSEASAEYSLGCFTIDLRRLRRLRRSLAAQVSWPARSVLLEFAAAASRDLVFVDEHVFRRAGLQRQSPVLSRLAKPSALMRQPSALMRQPSALTRKPSSKKYRTVGATVTLAPAATVSPSATVAITTDTNHSGHRRASDDTDQTSVDTVGSDTRRRVATVRVTAADFVDRVASVVRQAGRLTQAAARVRRDCGSDGVTDGVLDSATDTDTVTDTDGVTEHVSTTVPLDQLAPMRLHMLEQRRVAPTQHAKALADSARARLDALRCDVRDARAALLRTRETLDAKRVALQRRLDLCEVSRAALLEQRSQADSVQKTLTTRREELRVEKRKLRIRAQKLIFRLFQILKVRFHCAADFDENSFDLANKFPTDGEWRIQGLALATQNDEELSTALGHVAHCVLMLAKYLGVSLRYRIVLRASRSVIYDDVRVFSGGSSSSSSLHLGTDRLTAAGSIGNERSASLDFPLYNKGAAPARFEAAVRLLNADIAQLLLASGATPRFTPADDSLLPTDGDTSGSNSHCGMGGLGRDAHIVATRRRKAAVAGAKRALCDTLPHLCLLATTLVPLLRQGILQRDLQ